MIVRKAEKVVRDTEEHGIIIDEDRGSNLKKNDVLINTKLKESYKLSSIHAVVTGSEEEFLIPEADVRKFISDKGTVNKRPDDEYERRYWHVLQDNEENIKSTKSSYIIDERFTLYPDDRPLVKMMKRTINDEVPIRLEVSSRSDKRRFKERMKEIRHNHLSAKQFFNLCRQMNFKVDMTVWKPTENKDHDGFTENII